MKIKYDVRLVRSNSCIVKQVFFTLFFHWQWILYNIFIKLVRFVNIVTIPEINSMYNFTENTDLWLFFTYSFWLFLKPSNKDTLYMNIQSIFFYIKPCSTNTRSKLQHLNFNINNLNLATAQNLFYLFFHFPADMSKLTQK